MKTLQKIPFTEIESIPKLIKDFLEQKIEGFESELFSLENIREKIEQRENNFSNDRREVIYQAFKNQLSEIKLSEEQQTNLLALKETNTFTITTGHQLNLFSGPVFFVYKILQTIKTVDFLNQKFPENTFVPVFWMATEDHDFPEINHFKTENNYYEINEKSGGAVGKITITDQYFISDFEKEFKDDVFGSELILILKEAYKKGNTLTEATRILVDYLFSDYGLLMLDGNDKLLKKEMIDTFKDELQNQTLFNSTQNKVQFLRENYGKVQVNPRGINLFYLTETRNRIDENEDSFNIVDENIEKSKEELLKELEISPEKFSPNALLRPVFQETVLPNLAYIGGNAEIMYWLELKDYFKKIGLPFPVLIPRNSMLMLEEKIVKKIGKLDLSINDFFGNFSELIKTKVLENHAILEVLEKQENQLKNNFNELNAVAETTDITFGNMVKAEEKRQLKSFDRFHKRLLRAEKIKQKELVTRLENLFVKIHPSKIWQERVYNFSVFYADNGQDWLKTCYDEMNVNLSQLIILVD